MSIALRKIIRDKVVNDATMKTFFSAAATGSCAFYPTYMERSGTFPQVIYSIIDGPTDPGMNSQNGSIEFAVQVQNTASINPHIAVGNICERLSGLFDDVTLTGAGLTGTAVVSLLVIRNGGAPITYDTTKKIYTKVMIYGFKSIG